MLETLCANRLISNRTIQLLLSNTKPFNYVQAKLVV